MGKPIGELNGFWALFFKSLMVAVIPFGVYVVNALHKQDTVNARRDERDVANVEHGIAFNKRVSECESTNTEQWRTIGQVNQMAAKVAAEVQTMMERMEAMATDNAEQWHAIREINDTAREAQSRSINNEREVHLLRGPRG